jgi:hypothetical protein
MKKFIIISLLLLSVLSCKKKELSPEGPTDVRIRNKSDLTFEGVIVSTSERAGDTVTIGNISNGSTSDYFRFTKAYPKAEVSAIINVSGSLVKFSTAPVSMRFIFLI